MAEVLEVEKREQVGSSATQRLRRNGRIPAVLYGHGEGMSIFSAGFASEDVVVESQQDSRACCDLKKRHWSVRCSGIH